MFEGLEHIRLVWTNYNFYVMFSNIWMIVLIILYECIRILLGKHICENIISIYSP
jgi:hypothetical protein